MHQKVRGIRTISEEIIAKFLTISDELIAKFLLYYNLEISGWHLYLVHLVLWDHGV